MGDRTSALEMPSWPKHWLRECLLRELMVFVLSSYYPLDKASGSSGAWVLSKLPTHLSWCTVRPPVDRF